MKYYAMDRIFAAFLAAVCLVSCAPAPTTGEDEQVTTLGNLEVTAQLLEFPGELVNKPFYDYVFVFKYKILDVHRGDLAADTIHVGQYNPLKPRATVTDARVEDIGGNLEKFQVGDIHRIALDAPIDDYYMGGIINRYFDEKPDPIYWAVWTNRVVQ
jgi:hypothetical protein